MAKPSFDPGLTQQFTGPLRRAINQDGTFNVHRRGANWRDFHPYLLLINMSWPGFFAVLFLGYLAVNTVFAIAYYALGAATLAGTAPDSAFERFLYAFFFSSHTLSTVGYGNMYPRGIAGNAVASFEALVGVLGFAVATGLLFGRVSRPSARIGFSEAALIAAYQDGTSLQFRVVNRRPNSLMELEARVMLMTVETRDGVPKREYRLLHLEREQLLFLPLTWTVVHPIDEASPLWGRSADDLERLQAEFLVLVKAYDDTFSQTVVARHSYRHDELRWGIRFAPAFFVDHRGDLVLELQKVGDTAGAG